LLKSFGHISINILIFLSAMRWVLTTAEEIYKGAISDAYNYCYKNDLAQVWSYLWNRWYMPAQWKLWAWSAYPGIPCIKTTMIVESMWKHIKHCDLAEFNCP
jgi:hypothetical protein